VIDYNIIGSEYFQIKRSSPSVLEPIIYSRRGSWTGKIQFLMPVGNTYDIGIERYHSQTGIYYLENSVNNIVCTEGSVKVFDFNFFEGTLPSWSF